MFKVLLLVLAVAGAFVWFSSAGLPPMVASHFGPGGAADGFMDRESFRAVMLAVVVGVPALIGCTGQLVRVLPIRSINLPNRQYWLAPERREATIASLSTMSVPFAAAMAAFLCLVHWLVVQANAVQPPRLPEGSLWTAMAVLGVAVALWLVAWYRRFGRVPAAGRR